MEDIKLLVDYIYSALDKPTPRIILLDSVSKAVKLHAYLDSLYKSQLLHVLKTKTNTELLDLSKNITVRHNSNSYDIKSHCVVFEDRQLIKQNHPLYTVYNRLLLGYINEETCILVKK